MKIHKIFLALFMLAFILNCDLMAYKMYFEGSLRDDNGYAVVNQTGISANAYIYSDAESDTVYADCGTVTFDTDENGNFGVYVNGVPLPTDGKQYYLGLTIVSSNKKITPRMKISSAPYAVYAKEASNNISPEINLASTDLTIGTATVDELNSANSLNVSGALNLSAVPSYVKDLHVKNLKFSADSPVSLLEPQSFDGISTRWDQFADNAGNFTVQKSEEKELVFSTKADAILMVAARSDESGGEAKFYLSINVGGFNVCDNRIIITDSYDENIECVIFTIPVKKGELVRVRGRCEKSGLYWREGRVKLRLMYFGKH